jgi:hypothetical protein
LGFFKGENKMGRPLKIKKIIESAYNSSTGANPGVDIGFNAFNQLTNPVLPVGGALNADQFVGVVGGVQPPTVATATYPIVKVEVNIANSSSGQTPGVIIRQKGAHKFLVATTAGIDPANAVIGGSPTVALRIRVVGDTDWAAMGAPAGYGVGTIFTPTAASGAGTTGTAQEVGICVLQNDLTPTAGNMSISYFNGASDSTEQAISKLTNKFLLDFTGGETGGSANTGDGWDQTQVIQNVRYATNFFSDEGYEVKSGTTGATNTGTQQNRLDLAQVEKYTS